MKKIALILVTFVMAQLFSKLTMTDINCKYFFCAIFKHTISKSSGRCTHIYANFVIQINLKIFNRIF